MSSLASFIILIPKLIGYIPSIISLVDRSLAALEALSKIFVKSPEDLINGMARTMDRLARVETKEEYQDAAEEIRQRFKDL